MKYFSIRLILTFEETYYPLLEQYISEIKCNDFSVHQDFARRCFVIDYNDEWVENAFKVLKYDEYKALFDLQYSNAVLRLCLDAETDSDLFDIGLSTDSLKLLSKLNTKLDIDFYHYLT